MLDGFLLILNSNEIISPTNAKIIQLKPLLKNGIDCSEKLKIDVIKLFCCIHSGNARIASKIDEITVNPITIL